MEVLVISELKVSTEKKVEINCPFCNIDKSDKNITHVSELEFGSVFLNFNQSYLGRCLYIPEYHFNSLNEISEHLFLNFSKEVNFVARNIQELFNADLVNVAMLSNKVSHIHWHIIPRYTEDENWGFAPWPMNEKILPDSEMKLLREKIKLKLINAC
jgi:diadenosine tetraphosphate (Ap4A) HIT family hydrolase